MALKAPLLTQCVSLHGHCKRKFDTQPLSQRYRLKTILLAEQVEGTGTYQIRDATLAATLQFEAKPCLLSLYLIHNYS